MIRNFFIFALFASNFCFGVLFFPWLQDWWVDQHGSSTGHVPAKLWYKAKRYTDWAQESLSGPVGVEDLLCHVVTCWHYIFCLLGVGLILLVTVAFFFDGLFFLLVLFI